MRTAIKALGHAALCLLTGLFAVTVTAAGAVYKPSDIICYIDDASSYQIGAFPQQGESPLGSVAADAVRAAAGTEIALVNSGDLSKSLPLGAVCWSDMTAVFSENRQLALVQITPARLKSLLETSVSHITVDASTETIDRAYSDFKGFCQISGFTFTYDASAPAGTRVLAVKLSEGKQLDLKDNLTLLTLAAPINMLSGEYGYTPHSGIRPQSICLDDALAQYLSNGKLDQPGQGGRIIVIGQRNGMILGSFTPALLIAGCGVIALIFLFAFRKNRNC